jgi:hypothetical protein
VRTPAVAARLPVRGPKTSRGSRGSRLGLTPKGLREQPHPRGARKQASGGSRLTPPCQRETFKREGPCGVRLSCRALHCPISTGSHLLASRTSTFNAPQFGPPSTVFHLLLCTSQSEEKLDRQVWSGNVR